MQYKLVVTNGICNVLSSLTIIACKQKTVYPIKTRFHVLHEKAYSRMDQAKFVGRNFLKI